MRRILLCLVVFIMLGPVTVQATSPKPESVPQDSLFELGRQAYQDEDYRLAARYLDYYVLNYPLADQVTAAQYYLAHSYYKLKRFQEASVEFEFLYKQFPESVYAEEAQIRAAECTFEISEPYYREQDLTLTSQRMAEAFLRRYPDSEFTPLARRLLARIQEKLALKELAAAKLYFQFGEYQAALVSLEYILDAYTKAPKAAAEAKYYMALCKSNLGEKAQARDILKGLLDNPLWEEKARKALENL